MIKILYIILLSLIVVNCSTQKVLKQHGTPSLLVKSKKLLINNSNKNDIIKLLGSPSTISKFDKNTLIYIEQKKTASTLKNLGKMKIYQNDVLVLKINDYGILEKKELFNKEDMKNIQVSTDVTGKKFKKNTFIYNLMSSMRQKINDPLGQRAKKRKEISQR
jgi:outer membrane protein assembly factor BamE (lipoprotein component of BamABCDE complex)